LIRSVGFTKAADTDLFDAQAWYDRQQGELGDRFVQAIASTITVIAETPAIYPEVRPNIRKAPVQGFPYRIFYEVAADSILVIAVFHNQRSPSVWRSRT
jgi:plasmid stabilization system protein ParE